MKTRDQKYALAAFCAVSSRISQLSDNQKKEYRSFAKSFPCLIHTCGLLQAMSFAANDDKKKPVLDDFVKVLKDNEYGTKRFVDDCRAAEMLDYVKECRFAMMAASWLKRQTDALI